MENPEKYIWKEECFSNTLTNVDMKHITFFAFLIVFISSCATSPAPTENNVPIRWPDFIRDWAADFEIDDARRLSVIDEIDSLYMMLENRSSYEALLSERICKLKDDISDFIRYDSIFDFALMMRATIGNIHGWIYNNPWQLEKDNYCDLKNFLFLESQWNTSSTDNYDLMYTTFTENSWTACDRFINLLLYKEDGYIMPMTIIEICNYTDTVIDNTRIIFSDGNGNILSELNKKDFYLDTSTTDVCIKRLRLYSPFVMKSLATNGLLTITYNTPHDTVVMTGAPQDFFKEQIVECPRLKGALN